MGINNDNNNYNYNNGNNNINYNNNNINYNINNITNNITIIIIIITIIIIIKKYNVLWLEYGNSKHWVYITVYILGTVNLPICNDLVYTTGWPEMRIP